MILLGVSAIAGEAVWMLGPSGLSHGMQDPAESDAVNRVAASITSSALPVANGASAARVSSTAVSGHKVEGGVNGGSQESSATATNSLTGAFNNSDEGNGVDLSEREYLLKNHGG